MRITPIEIRKKTFEKSFRGYEVDGVAAFLHSLSKEWERLITSCDTLTEKLEMSQKEVSRLKDLENALLKNMKVSEDTARSIVNQAEKNAEILLKEAALEAEKTIQKAHTESQQIVEKTKVDLEKTKKEIHLQECYLEELTQKIQLLAQGVLQQADAAKPKKTQPVQKKTKS